MKGIEIEQDRLINKVKTGIIGLILIKLNKNILNKVWWSHIHSVKTKPKQYEESYMKIYYIKKDYLIKPN